MKKNKIENAETPALPQGAVTGLAAKGAAVEDETLTKNKIQNENSRELIEIIRCSELHRKAFENNK